MDLFEYQARDLFEAHGVPVLRGIVASTPEAARKAAEDIGGLTVVKAQVKVGGRGKAGGIRIAATPEKAYEAAGMILGMEIKGHIVKQVMVVEGADIEEEYYFSILLDRANRSYLALCSREGGVEIEQLAAEKPEALARVEVNPLVGINEFTAREIVTAAGFDQDVADRIVPVLKKLYEVYHDEDATLVEVNPMVRTASGDILALDGKITLDGNADFRHDNRAALAESAGSIDLLELKAKKNGLNYVKLEGTVGIIGNGAGLVMSTLDIVDSAGRKHGGQKPANFLDIGGGASADSMAVGLDIILGDPQVRSVLVNVFGGITACDVVANGIVSALDALDVSGQEAQKPIVVRLDGNNVEEGRRILADYNHPLVTLAFEMDAAADKAAALAASPDLAPMNN